MIAWTFDALATPTCREIVDELSMEGVTYRLVRDENPPRWYITRTIGRTCVRTVIYNSRNAPALKRAWENLRKGRE